MPLAFINILIGVDHPSFSLRMSVDPVSVVSVTIRVEEGASSVAAVFVPIARILAAKFFVVTPPESPLSMFLINSPHTFVFIAVLVVLYAESLFAVIAPVTDVSTGAFPFLSFDCAVFLFILLLNPID